MTAGGPDNPQRFRLLATFVAGRSVDISEAPAGQPAHTDGRVIFVSAGRSADEQRREVLAQSALLGAGSLDRRLMKGLRGRPPVARRYLTLEGDRALAELARRSPLAAELRPGAEPVTASADASLEMARGRARLDDPPPWFGVIRPSRLLGTSPGPGARPTDHDVHLAPEIERSDADDDRAEDADGSPERSLILKLFESPLVVSQSVSDFLRKLFGGSTASDDSAAGAELPVRSTRRTGGSGPDARPLPTRLHVTDDGKPGSSLGVSGALHPEWDVYHNNYRPDWCRVVHFSLPAGPDTGASTVARDDVLRRRLSRIGLGPKLLRRRPDGDEFDTEALIDFCVDLRSGYSPDENLYVERRAIARDLGVLILVDASGSAIDSDPDGLAVHEHQRRAATTLAGALEGLGDRVAVYAFRSHGRHAVQLPAIKTFGQRFDAARRASLDALEPSGYTRLGAAIRGAGEILKTQAGTPSRLLVVLSDGFPYDDHYEGRYAEADARKALEELRIDGVACLCLTIGSGTDSATVERVFGSASHAHAPALSDLSPRMDTLFLAALRQLAAPKIQRAGGNSRTPRGRRSGAI